MRCANLCREAAPKFCGEISFPNNIGDGVAGECSLYELGCAGNQYEKGDFDSYLVHPNKCPAKPLTPKLIKSNWGCKYYDFIEIIDKTTRD